MTISLFLRLFIEKILFLSALLFTKGFLVFHAMIAVEKMNKLTTYEDERDLRRAPKVD